MKALAHAKTAVIQTVIGNTVLKLNKDIDIMPFIY